MKETIMIISNVSNGLYMFRRELIEKLLVDYRIEVLAGDTGSVSKLEDLGCNVTITDFNRHGTNPLHDARLIRYYKTKIKELRPFIVLTYTIKPNIYGGIACARMHVPYIANITGLGNAIEKRSKISGIILLLMKYGLRRAQIVFFQNESNQDYLLKNKVITGRYKLIPGSGVNLERFPLLKYPEGETVDFVFISRLIKEKGIDQVLEAAEYIHRKYPYTRFHICGDGAVSYAEKVKELHRKGIVNYHGKINDIVAMYQISACTIHPTYYPEGMSNVLLESCACGRPIVTTDRPGCREIVDDGINGYVVKQQDSQHLIDKIEKFLSLNMDERMKMGLAGRRKVEEYFDRKIVVDKYIEEIKRAKL